MDIWIYSSYIFYAIFSSTVQLTFLYCSSSIVQKQIYISLHWSIFCHQPSTSQFYSCRYHRLKEKGKTLPNWHLFTKIIHPFALPVQLSPFFLQCYSPPLQFSPKPSQTPIQHSHFQSLWTTSCGIKHAGGQTRRRINTPLLHLEMKMKHLKKQEED